MDARARTLLGHVTLPAWLAAAALSLLIAAGALLAGQVTAAKPLLAAGAVAAGALVVASLVFPDLATVAAVLIIYSNVAVVAVRFHGVPRIAGQAVVLLFVVPIVAALLWKRRGLVVHPALPLLFLFLAVQALGTAFCRDPATALSGLREYFIEGLAVFFLVTNAVRSPASLRSATWALLAAGLVAAMVPIYQQVTHSFGSNFGGFGQTNELGFRTGEFTNHGEMLQSRLSGTIGEQNRFAQSMLMLVPIGALLALSQRRRSLRLLALFLAGVAAVGCALAYSRGAAVAFLITVAVMFAMRLIRLRHLAAGALAVALVLAAMPQYRTRLATIGSIPALFGGAAAAEHPDGAVRGRATEMLAAISVFADHPVVGVGPSMFKTYSRQYGNRLGIRRLDEDRESHSLLPGLAAETGALGLVCFLGAVGVTMHGLWRPRVRLARSDRQPELAALTAGYFAALVAYLASGLFLHMAYIRFFYLVLGLGAAATLIAADAEERREGEAP